MKYIFLNLNFFFLIHMFSFSAQQVLIYSYSDCFMFLSFFLFWLCDLKQHFVVYFFYIYFISYKNNTSFLHFFRSVFFVFLMIWKTSSQFIQFHFMFYTFFYIHSIYMFSLSLLYLFIYFFVVFIDLCVDVAVDIYFISGIKMDLLKEIKETKTFNKKTWRVFLL